MTKAFKISKDKLPNAGIFRVLATLADVIITFSTVQITYENTQYSETQGYDVDACNCSEFNMIPPSCTVDPENRACISFSLSSSSTTASFKTFVLHFVMITYGLVSLLLLGSRILTMTTIAVKNKKEDCSCGCTIKFFLKLGNGLLYICSGLLYLHGDNAKEIECDEFSTVGNTTLCGVFIPKRMNGTDLAQEEMQRLCIETADLTLGIALILNVILYLVEKSENCSWMESWRKDDADDKWKKPIKDTRWMKVLSHLSTVALIDQVLTTTQSQFLSDEDSEQCTEKTQIFGWLAFGITIVAMQGIISIDLPWPCCRKRDRTTEIEKIVSYIIIWGIGLLLMMSSGLYLSGDMPFPWDCEYECKHSQPQYIRRNLLAASLPLIVIFTALHIVIVDILSFCAQANESGEKLPACLEKYEPEDDK